MKHIAITSRIKLDDTCIDTSRVKMRVRVTFSDGTVSEHISTAKNIALDVFEGTVVKFEVLGCVGRPCHG